MDAVTFKVEVCNDKSQDIDENGYLSEHELLSRVVQTGKPYQTAEVLVAPVKTLSGKMNKIAVWLLNSIAQVKNP